MRSPSVVIITHIEYDDMCIQGDRIIISHYDNNNRKNVGRTVFVIMNAIRSPCIIACLNIIHYGIELLLVL